MADASHESRKGCLRRGCMGCLAVFGGLFALVAVWVAVTLVRGTPDVVPEDDSLTHALPARPAAPPLTDGAAERPLQLDEGSIGRIVLDVGMTHFSIVPAPAGSELKLDARYDSGSFRLRESMESDGELGWTYRLSFGARSFFQFIRVNEENSRLVLHVPEGTPLSIEGTVGVGESDFELGGLWIERLDLEAGVGEHRVSFSAPLSHPMKSFRYDGSIGETSIGGLGNASPAEATIRHRIGEVSIDLTGAWRNDAVVHARSSLGEFRIGLPGEEFGFELLQASIGIGEADTERARARREPPPGAPRITLDANHALGELSLSR